MKRRLFSKKNKKGKAATLYVGEYARHLKEDESKIEVVQTTPWARLRDQISSFLEHVHERGRERLTVMVIPHTEKKILTLHLSLYAIFATAFLLFVVLVVSVLNLIGKSGREIQFYDMGLSNSQFNLQSMKMAEEMIPLHELVTDYSSTIADIYLKLDGKPELVEGQGGVAHSVSASEVVELQNLVNLCKKQGDDCGQELTEEILGRVIQLSEEDNFNLSRATELSEKILEELKTPEKQNLLKNTPSIWPTNGALLAPYGMQFDRYEGREKFSRGLTIGALPGSRVVATAPGHIKKVFYDSERGLQILIQHKYGIQTYYANLSRSRVKKGDKVQKGQTIAYVGNSGLAHGYQLYYEVHVGTVAYNPHAFLNHLQDQWLIRAKN